MDISAYKKLMDCEVFNPKGKGAGTDVVHKARGSEIRRDNRDALSREKILPFHTYLGSFQRHRRLRRLAPRSS